MATAAQQLADALSDRIKVWKVGPGGIVIDIDSNDPDTPAMVYDSMRKEFSSTYNCALEMGIIDDQVDITPAQQKFLQSFEELVDRAFNVARRDLPQYK